MKIVFNPLTGKFDYTDGTLSQAKVSPDSTEAQTWDAALTTLVNNLNRIRYGIVTISGEAWGTFSHSIATVWGKFNAATGHKHSGAADDGAQIDHGGLGGLADDDHTQYVLKSGNITQITTRSHTSLSNIGTNAHSAIDTAITNSTNHIAAASPHSGHTIMTTGSYAGDNTANRAIPHGLGRTPKHVSIESNQSDGIRHLSAGFINYADQTSALYFALTTWDATNFYVGNAGGYWGSANASGSTFYWVAEG